MGNPDTFETLLGSEASLFKMKDALVDTEGEGIKIKKRSFPIYITLKWAGGCPLTPHLIHLPIHWSIGPFIRPLTPPALKSRRLNSDIVSNLCPPMSEPYRAPRVTTSLV